MKKGLLFISMMFLGTSFLCAENVKEINSPIKQVTVFADRAQVFHETSISIPAGQTTLNIVGLSPYINPQSIQVKGIGNFTIMSVSKKNNYLQNLDEQQDVKALNDKLKEIELKIENENDAVTILKEKHEFFVANRAVMGNNTSFSLEQFKSMSNYYNSNIEQITKELTEKARLIKEYEKEAESLLKQINEMKGRGNLPTGAIEVNVTADRAVTGTLSYSYVVTHAGWYPSYDIRVDNINSPVSVIYKANVYQSTGVSWKDVKLTFSNASPSMSGTAPTITPSYVWIYEPRPVVAARGAVMNSKAMVFAADEAMEYAEEEEEAMEDYDMMVAASSSNFTALNEGQTTISFEISTPYSVQSDGKTQTIEINKNSMNAEYKYYAAPRLSNHAFLKGSVADWSGNGYQNGDATLYFENSYVGNSVINVRDAEENLSLSLGIDNSVIVSREKRQDYTSKKTVGSNKTDTYSYLITVKNNKTIAIKMDVEDQIPISQNSEITVESLELSGGKLDKDTGKITWSFELAPQQSKNIILTYSIKYPKNKRIEMN
ncbi:MAG: mucoidy inhibitor MuiA family protein [Bacteroidales bacterium]|nr:mucoidy inhibitor MuiA family protein [Bacteroidales bacterium]